MTVSPTARLGRDLNVAGGSGYQLDPRRSPAGDSAAPMFVEAAGEGGASKGQHGSEQRAAPPTQGAHRNQP